MQSFNSEQDNMMMHILERDVVTIRVKIKNVRYMHPIVARHVEGFQGKHGVANERLACRRKVVTTYTYARVIGIQQCGAGYEYERSSLVIYQLSCTPDLGIDREHSRLQIRPMIGYNHNAGQWFVDWPLIRIGLTWVIGV